jgi:hypothetical protein
LRKPIVSTYIATYNPIECRASDKKKTNVCTTS